MIQFSSKIVHEKFAVQKLYFKSIDLKLSFKDLAIYIIENILTTFYSIQFFQYVLSFG